MFIKSFKKLSKKDVGIAGGKGASLSEMAGANFPVPPGFVVLADAFDRFLDETDLALEVATKLKNVNFEDTNTIDRASNEIRDMIGDTKFPKDIAKEILAEYRKLENLINPHLISPFKRGRKGRAEGEKQLFVAVRSSATAEDSTVASWAGELESYLNVTEKNLLDSVKKCWSSLFTARAIFYRYEKNLIDQKVSVAVVVQKMVQSEISGICFTVHPVTENYDQMVIEAGYGLGEAIVGGKITPDTYIVSKSKVKSQKSNLPHPARHASQGEAGGPNLPLDKGKERKGCVAILDKNISEQRMMIVMNKKRNGVEEVNVPKSQQEKQKLSDKKIFELAKICLDIEKHYHKPQDIEWAMENDKIYVTQSRPITTLQKI